MAERRQVPRYSFGGPARLAPILGGAASDISVLSISVLGCRAKGANVPAVGQKCRLSIDWEAKEFSCEAEVKWKKPGGDVGLKFSPLDDKNRIILRELCATLRLEPLAPMPLEPE